jgi:DNA repair exonuclease SbcCD ATPase subunit
VIRRLRLTNWRNYEDVSISFEQGTTFVVASNGVGKTSLVEAARWALFGTPATSAASPIRVGADHATSTVELVLPTGEILTVERTIPAKASRQPATPSIQLDGRQIDIDAFAACLHEGFGTEPAFLARLTMPAASRDEDTPKALGLEDHLGRYFGVDGLQRAIDALKESLRTTTKRISQIKIANASSAQQLDDLGEALAAAAATVDDAANRHQVAQAAQERLRVHLQGVQRTVAWNARQSQWISQTGALVERAADALDATVDTRNVAALLATNIDDLSQATESTRIEIAVRAARAETIRTNQASLDGSHGDCPVCRRPLDDPTIALAHQSNENELETIAAEIQALQVQEESAVTRRSELQALLQQWRSIADPGPEPEPAAEPGSDAVDVETATQEVSAAFERLVNARALQVDADRRLQAARDADEAMKELEKLFREEANIRVALETTKATLAELLGQTIRPLAAEVDQRWKALFPNRGELTTHADGSITRNVDGHPLPYDAFSTAESMGATIVMRLLVAQMATTADFCWFDEPLEHLDPDVRRQVANMLSRATDGNGPLRQIVVTTYEEPLARHLQARNPERVHLIEVRQAPPPTQHDERLSAVPI